MSGKRLIVITAWTPSLIHFREHLLRFLQESGYPDILALGPQEDPVTRARLDALGISFRQLPLERTGLHPWKDLQTIRFLTRLFRDERPDLVFAYNIKPVVYSGLAARRAKVPRFCALIPGLGYAFSGQRTARGRVVHSLARLLYRRGLRHAEAVLFQNPDDLELFREQRLLASTTRTAVVPGSGVPLDHYTAAPLPPGPPRFLFIGRLVADKGLREYVAAAGALKVRYPDWRFSVLGALDSNPHAVTSQELDKWIAEGAIDYLGLTDDVRPYFRDCHVFVLPSYYFEGIPRTLLEALSMGRPVITTDFRGCRETVREPSAPDDNGIRQGANGLLIPPRNAAALQLAMELLGNDSSLRQQMARASRAYAEERFDVHEINRQMLHLMSTGCG